MVAVAALGLAACAAEFTREAAIDSFVATNEDASRQQAGCVVDRLVDGYTLTGLEEELAAERLDADFEEAQFRAEFGCGMRSGVEASLVSQLEASGIETADAECAADELVDSLEESDLDVLLTGELTDTFYTKYFDSLERCDALPE